MSHDCSRFFFWEIKYRFSYYQSRCIIFYSSTTTTISLFSIVTFYFLFLFRLRERTALFQPFSLFSLWLHIAPSPSVLLLYHSSLVHPAIFTLSIFISDLLHFILHPASHKVAWINQNAFSCSWYWRINVDLLI